MKNKNANKQLTKAELFSKIDQLYQPCSDPKSVSEEDCKSCEQRLQEAIDLADRYGHTIKQADILLKLCSCGVNHAQYSQAWDRITQLFGLLGEDTSYPNLHRAINLRARLHWIKGDYQAAVTDYQKALELFRQANMLPEGAGMCMNISSLLSKMGRMEEALYWIDEAHLGFTQCNDHQMVQMTKSTKGNLLWSMGRLEDAFSLKKQCEEYFASINNLRQQSIELNTMAVLSNLMNHNDIAIDYCHKAIAIKEGLGDHSGLAEAWTNLGVFYMDYGDDIQAEKYYLKALDRYSQRRDKIGICTILNNLGNIYMKRGSFEEAKSSLEKALPLVRELQNVNKICSIQINLGLIYLKLGINAEEGVKLQSEAAQMALESEDLYSYTLYCTYLASSLSAVKRHQDAIEILDKALIIASENQYDKLIGEIYKQYDLCYAAAGNPEAARSKLLLYCERAEAEYNRDMMKTITEMKTKYETEKKEQEAEIYRLKNIELEAKNRLIEDQKSKLEDTLDKLHRSEIRYDFVSEELTRNINTTLIGCSQIIKAVTKMIAMVAKSEKTNVLITGETGTGKEIVARNIHLFSKRGKQHFYGVNCSAIPENLFESQFFGHEKDAFTGANSTKIGWFEVANGSTLFLDEIGTLSLEQQAKLLRAIQERTIVRVGSHREIPIDVRIVSATNVNLGNKVELEQFRNDLYHRLAVFVIHIPPLRSRREDVPLLLKHFVGISSTATNKKITKVDKDVLSFLADYDFPGNVRELKNMVERAVLVAESSTLRREHFVISGDLENPSANREIIPLDILEREMILKALQKTGYNRIQAAKLLGVGRKVVERKIQKYQINIPV